MTIIRGEGGGEQYAMFLFIENKDAEFENCSITSVSNLM